jgi:hypothetical protein
MAEEKQKACSGPPKPSPVAYAAGPGRPRNRRPDVRIEIIAVGGPEGDEIEARQLAVIWEVLHCLFARQKP